MHDIKDFEGYVSKMDITVIDKLFWLPHVTHPVTQLVDIGCACGKLQTVFNAVSPCTELIGIEENLDMVQKIYEGYDKGEIPFIRVHGLLDDIPGKLKPGSVINMSSVLHEVYSYKNKEYIKNFWKQINRLEPEYITIRDMMWNESDAYCPTDLICNTILHSVYAKQAEEFESKYGLLSEKKNLTHFLLKYRYKENWERELNENYFAFSIDDAIPVLNDNYKVIYHEFFALPWTAKCARNDFGISFLPGTTHQKIIYQRR